MEEWFPYSKITFRGEQVLWIVEHLDDLREGRYPPNPDQAIPARRQRQLQKEATFTKATRLAAEIDTRIDDCDEDGEIFLLIYKDQIDIPELAKKRGLTIEQVDLCCRKVLRYITGWKRKGGYKEYNRHGR